MYGYLRQPHGICTTPRLISRVPLIRQIDPRDRLSRALLLPTIQRPNLHEPLRVVRHRDEPVVEITRRHGIGDTATGGCWNKEHLPLDATIFGEFKGGDVALVVVATGSGRGPEVVAAWCHGYRVTPV